MSALPLVLEEQALSLFRFWHNGQVCEGMRHTQELYALVRAFQPDARLQAYDLACELSEHGSFACISRSWERYAVWISLRLPNLFNLALPEDPAVAAIAKPGAGGTGKFR